MADMCFLHDHCRILPETRPPDLSLGFCCSLRYHRIGLTRGGTAGVQSGGSIGMWQQYFGEGLQYHGVDINYLCAELFDGLPGEAINNTWAESASHCRFVKTQPVIYQDEGHALTSVMPCIVLSRFHGAGVRVTIGDQANKTFWEDFLANSPTFDIVIDDGVSRA